MTLFPTTTQSAARVTVRLRVAATAPALPALPVDDAQRTCGWFESSHALREGRAVSELPDSDGSVAALWFSALRPQRSAAWQ